ncbi:MAG: hypothetical protein AB7O88_28455 [Reyranellaceae bacterium]
MNPLPYVFRWDRHGRKGQPCAIRAKSVPAGRYGSPVPLAFGTPARPRFNSVLVRFADGYGMVTSLNAIRSNKGARRCRF